MANESEQPPVHGKIFAEHSEKLRESLDALEAEHQVLMEMLSRVANTPTPTIAYVFDATNELAQYLEQHFKDEENFMDWLEFPHRVAHKVTHKQVISILEDAIKQHASHIELWSFLGSFLARWLKDHVDHEDARILRYVHEKFGGATPVTQYD